MSLDTIPLVPSMLPRSALPEAEIVILRSSFAWLPFPYKKDLKKNKKGGGIGGRKRNSEISKEKRKRRIPAERTNKQTSPLSLSLPLSSERVFDSFQGFLSLLLAYGSKERSTFCFFKTCTETSAA